LVVIDPVSPFFIAGSPNDQRSVAWSLADLTMSCRDRSITILSTAYQGKQKADKQDVYKRAIDRIAGSAAFAGYSHTQIYLEEPEPPKIPYYVLGWRPRHAPEETFRFTRDANGLFVPWNPPAMDSRVAALLQLFPQDGLIISLEEILEHLPEIPMSQATCYRVLRELEGTRIEKVKRGYYRLITIN
jgi:hypothetical protein